MLQYSNLFYFISGAWRQFGRFSQLWLSRVVHFTWRGPCGLTCSSFPRWLHFGSMRGYTTSSSSCWPCHSCRGLTSCVFRMMEERAPPSLQPLTSYIRHQWRRSYLSNFHCGIQWYLVFFYCIEPHLPLSTRSQAGAIAWIRQHTAYIISFYQLIPVLFWEAELVQSRIAASDLERDVRRTSHVVQQKIAQRPSGTCRKRSPLPRSWRSADPSTPHLFSDCDYANMW